MTEMGLPEGRQRRNQRHTGRDKIPERGRVAFPPVMRKDVHGI